MACGGARMTLLLAPRPHRTYDQCSGCLAWKKRGAALCRSCATATSQFKDYTSRAGKARWGNRSVEERFWSFVEKSEGCWTWVGMIGTTGYGQFWDGHHLSKAHRFSYRLHKGELPSELHVCHSCDNPLCVNPAHLWLGTDADNLRDMWAKGRGWRGGSRKKVPA